MRNVKILFMLLTILLLCGCSDEIANIEEGEYYLSYTNLESTGLIREVYEAEGKTAEALIPELLAALNQEPKDSTHFRILSESVKVENYEYNGNMLVLNMSPGYLDMSKTKEVLVRAGLVRTFVQIDGIDSVQILVSGEPLKDSKGNDIGPMNEKTFIENSGKEINSYKSASVQLYFTNAEGNRLIAEKRNLYYSSNVPLEQIIVEQLIKGPKNGGNYATMPGTASVLSVVIVEGTCYVNLNKAFIESPLNVQQEIPIYSISQSIIENCNVENVQIAIEGETELIFRESMELNKLYQKNNALVLEEG